jgi:hypothetical protein
VTDKPTHASTQTPYVTDRLDGLEDWERRVLAKLAMLRLAGKRAILEITEQGVILVFVLERAGRVE